MGSARRKLNAAFLAGSILFGILIWTSTGSFPLCLAAVTVAIVIDLVAGNLRF